MHGTHDTVNRILDHPDIKAVSFVGSNNAGRYIYARGSANGKRVQVGELASTVQGGERGGQWRAPVEKMVRLYSVCVDIKPCMGTDVRAGQGAGKVFVLVRWFGQGQCCFGGRHLSETP